MMPAEHTPTSSLWFLTFCPMIRNILINVAAIVQALTQASLDRIRMNYASVYLCDSIFFYTSYADQFFRCFHVPSHATRSSLKLYYHWGLLTDLCNTVAHFQVKPSEGKGLPKFSTGKLLFFHIDSSLGFFMCMQHTSNRVMWWLEFSPLRT